MEPAVAITPKPAVAVAALIGVDAASTVVLQECFRQFGIYAVAVPADAAGPLSQDRFGACVLPLDDRAPAVLEAIRQSPHNAHTVIYGVCASLHQAMAFSQFGINAVFLYPVERNTALNVVRMTHLLVLHQLRRYVRVPLVTAAVLRAGAEDIPASTVEISTGGLSLHTSVRLAMLQSLEVKLQLPHAEPLSLRAVVCWIRYDEDLAGLRFEPSDPQRARLRRWIDDYLGED